MGGFDITFGPVVNGENVIGAPLTDKTITVDDTTKQVTEFTYVSGEQFLDPKTFTFSPGNNAYAIADGELLDDKSKFIIIKITGNTGGDPPNIKSAFQVDGVDDINSGKYIYEEVVSATNALPGQSGALESAPFDDNPTNSEWNYWAGDTTSQTNRLNVQSFDLDSRSSSDGREHQQHHYMVFKVKSTYTGSGITFDFPANLLEGSDSEFNTVYNNRNNSYSIKLPQTSSENEINTIKYIMPSGKIASDQRILTGSIISRSNMKILKTGLVGSLADDEANRLTQGKKAMSSSDRLERLKLNAQLKGISKGSASLNFQTGYNSLTDIKKAKRQGNIK